ncbi:MAG: tRNA (adenosine(37)-N6)-threonylcarbamoyltransferase complex dimerization subunit type 1 TsaB [Planctomycetes bacterium]|nr:tRNA (adenosine(37)-N6)-threonylcarbamoyltransferase complex dimerization subunit type 1 TsaB [Planctomycetota bacterium]
MTNDPLILALETSSRIGSVALASGKNLLAQSSFSGPMRHSAEIFPAIVGLMDRFGRNPQQIDHVYISAGPGSFTGLRIAVTIAKTMHLANAAKIVPIDTLDVIAANVTEILSTTHANTQELLESNSAVPETSPARPLPINKIAAILDAKRNQFFIAVYNHSPKADNTPQDSKHAIRDTQYGIWKKTMPDSLMTAARFLDEFAQPGHPIYLLGDGLLYHNDKFKADGTRLLDQKYWSPRASNVHLLGWQMALAHQFADPLTLTPKYIRRPQAQEKWQQR